MRPCCIPHLCLHLTQERETSSAIKNGMDRSSNREQPPANHFARNLRTRHSTAPSQACLSTRTCERRFCSTCIRGDEAMLSGQQWQIGILERCLPCFFISSSRRCGLNSRTINPLPAVATPRICLPAVCISSPPVSPMDWNRKRLDIMQFTHPTPIGSPGSALCISRARMQRRERASQRQVGRARQLSLHESLLS